jgi:hypothetical protein
MTINMTLDEIELHLKRVKESFQKQQITQTQLQTTLTNLQQQIGAIKSTADSELKNLDSEVFKLTETLRLLGTNLNPRFKTIEDIPGIRTPKWYEVDVAFEYDDNAERVASIQINAEGPFVITQVTAFWEYLDQDADHFANPVAAGNTPYKRLVPCTAYPMIVNNLGITNATTAYTTPSLSQLTNTTGVNTAWGPLSDIPEFDFQIEIGGSGRFWTNQPIPAAVLYGYGGQPMYLGVQGWIERSDRLVVHAIPLFNLRSKGTVKMCFHGYQILTHASISEALGY